MNTKMMEEREVLEVLGVAEETRWFQAIVSVLRDQELEASKQGAAPGTLMHPNAALIVTHCNGGEEWLRATRERLEELREREWTRKIKAADHAEETDG